MDDSMEHSHELITLRLIGRPGLGDDVAEHESKSALRIACDELAAGGTSASYGSRCLRRVHTLPELFALPVLWRFLKMDYRGIVAFAADWRELGEVLELAKVSHRLTPAHAARRHLAGAEK